MPDNLLSGYQLLETQPFAILMNTLVKLGKEVRQGEYAVHMGFVDWLLYPFDNGPKLAMAIMTADERPFAKEHMITVTVDMFARMPALRKDGVSGADPLISAAMKADIEQMFARLECLRVPDPRERGDTIPVIARTSRESARIVDVSDSEAKLQGIMFNVDLQLP
jgi:hypothetical protein